MNRSTCIVLLLIFSFLPKAFSQKPGTPIIDMHLHSFPTTWFGHPDSISWMHLPLKVPSSDDQLMKESLQMLHKYNIVRSVVSGPLRFVGKWRDAAPDRIIPSLFSNLTALSIDSLKNYFATDRIKVLGEITAQYYGLSPNDPQLEKYFAVVESLQMPIAWHLGLGPPGISSKGKYRTSLSSALSFEEVLARHPKLRIYIMHAGWPLLDDMVATLYAYPELYVDVAVINWYIPRKEFHAYLKRLIDAGFEKRIMFGSDQMVWPEAIRLAIEGVQSAAFLTEGQKRDIFYNNAARFLRLTDEEIERDHQMSSQ